MRSRLHSRLVGLSTLALFSSSFVLFSVYGGDAAPMDDIPRPEPLPIAEDAGAVIIFGGDMMFDRSIRKAIDEHARQFEELGDLPAEAAAKGGDYIFSCVADILDSADLVVANLEGPITSNPSVSVDTEVGGEGNYTFTFPTTTAELLARHNIRLVNLGNNHIMNFGRDGLFETLDWLERAGVAYMGNPDAPEAERVARLEVGGIPFSFVNWSDWTSDKTDHTVAEVRKEAEAGRMTVVYAHWGEEYEPPPERVRQLAHSFIDAGAELVVGSHPHIVQEHEEYLPALPTGQAGGRQVPKHIYYSLGNFIFDQYWDESVRRGLLLRVRFDPTGTASVVEVPIDGQSDRRTCAA